MERFQETEGHKADNPAPALGENAVREFQELWRSQRLDFRPEAETGKPREVTFGNDGSRQEAREGRARFTLDEKDRIKKIDWPDRKESREFEYYGDSREIRKLTFNDANGRTFVNTRVDSRSDVWEAADGEGRRLSPWRGEAAISANGVYSRRYTENQGRPLDGKWHSIWPDGTDTKDTVDGAGVRSSFDAQGKLRSRQTADGAVSTYDAGGSFTHCRAADGTTFTATGGTITRVGPNGETIKFTSDNGAWKSDSSRFPNEMRALAVTDRGDVRFATPAGDKHLVRTDGTSIVALKDGGRLEKDSRGEIESLSKGGIVRRFERDGGKEITRVVDTSKNGEAVVLDRAKEPGGSRAFVSPEGDLSRVNKDGSATIHRSNLLKVDLDRDGNITSVTRPDGTNRTFKYAAGQGEREPIEVNDVRKTARGDTSETWTRAVNADGSLSNTWKSEGRDGRERSRENLKLCLDGEYEYNAPGDKKIRTARLGRDAGDGQSSASVSEARENLVETMREHLDGPKLARFEAMMKGFESRMGDRSEARKLANLVPADKIQEDTERSVAKTYDNLAEMVASNSSAAVYDQKTRAKLAENFMFHAAEPTTIDQGPDDGRRENIHGGQSGHGTCWIQSGHIWGMIRHPDAMADLTKQVSLTGSYTTKNSGENDPRPKTETFSKDLLAIPADSQESRWSIDNATKQFVTNGRNTAWVQGDRSPLSRMYDHVLPRLAGRSEGNIEAGYYDDTQRFGKGTKNIMRMVTGDSPSDARNLLNNSERLTLLEKGSIITYGHRHMNSTHLAKVNGDWSLIADDQHGENKDRVVATIGDLSDWGRGGGGRARRVYEAVTVNKFDGTGDTGFGPVRPNQPVRPEVIQVADTGKQIDNPAPAPQPGCPTPDPRPCQPRPYVRQCHPRPRLFRFRRCG